MHVCCVLARMQWVSECGCCGGVICAVQALQDREEAVSNGKLATIIFLRDRNARGQEVCCTPEHDLLFILACAAAFEMI